MLSRSRQIVAGIFALKKRFHITFFGKQQALRYRQVQFVSESLQRHDSQLRPTGFCFEIELTENKTQAENHFCIPPRIAKSGNEYLEF